MQSIENIGENLGEQRGESFGQKVAVPEPTHFERLILRIEQMALWRKVLLALLFLALPYGLLYFEGAQSAVLGDESWRTVYFPTASILYIIVAAPWIWRAEKGVIEGLQKLIPVEPTRNETLEHKTWWRSSLGDWIAFGIGILGGLSLEFTSPLPDMRYWSARYWALTVLVMYGALVWLFYAAMGSARFTALLHRYVAHKDPFDLSPFEPVGGQGLILAVIFIGVITLSLIFIYSPTFFFDWLAVLIYSVLVLATVSIFFTVMWPAHRVLQRVKNEKIAAARRMIGQSYARLEKTAEQDAGTQAAPVATELQAWLSMEQRLKQTRAWPYDTEMLRTLFLSILTPLFVAIARTVGTYLTEGHF